MTSKRVLIADDDPFTRVTVTGTLSGLGYEVVAQADSVAEAMSLSADTPVDIAVLDLNLGEGPTGIDLARALRREHPDIGIVMLSTYEEPRLMGNNLPALPEGSVYVVKRAITEPGILERALQIASDPEAFSFASRIEESKTSALAGLSDHQIEIMRLIAAGYTNAEIARRIFINESSVEKAVARLIKFFDIQAGRDQNQRVMVAQFYFQLSGAVNVRSD